MKGKSNGVARSEEVRTRMKVSNDIVGGLRDE